MIATLSPASVLSNYAITYNTATFAITAKTASVTPGLGQSKVYGSPDPTLTGTLSGFLAADNVTATYSRAAGETVLGGPYKISAMLSPASVLSNYAISYNTATFAITAKTASVTPASGQSKVYGSSDPTLTGTLTGFLAADNVTATYSRAAGETVLGGPYTMMAATSVRRRCCPTTPSPTTRPPSRSPRHRPKCHSRLRLTRGPSASR